jgi:phospholipid/cholesterol/gamma-HCH transport system substrate-binding protein
MREKMRQNVIETIIGFIVLIIAVVFFAYAYQSSGKGDNVKGYILKATFQSAEGIVKGSDIMIAGIKVGSVDDLSLDKESYLAQVNLKLQEEVLIPKDSVAAIVSQGLLGGKYVMIMPGAEEENLKDNEVIQNTQSSINLESLIGKFMYSKGDSDSNK